MGKSFQPSYGALLAMLREDTHPLLYYSLLWLWGHAVGQSPVSLRLLSWIAYGLGGLVMVCQTRALGPWPLPKLLVLLLVLLALRRWGMERSAPEQRQKPTLLDVSGGIPSGLMVLGVVLISFVKPLAFSRYFVVLMPALVPWLSVRAASLPLTVWGRRASALGLALILVLWWHQSFVGITAAVAGSRESDQFRAIS